MLLFERLSPDYVYAKLSPEDRKEKYSILFTFYENESINAVLTLKSAEENAIKYTFPCAVFKLIENTSLTAVGITAKVSSLLAKNEIPCNVVAALHHDYFLVPLQRADEVSELLQQLD